MIEPSVGTRDLTPETVLRRLDSPAVEHVEIDGETVVYDCSRNALHLLDPIATVIWLSLDGTESLRETSEHLAEAFGRPVADTLNDVRTFAARLEAIALVERVG